MESVPEIVGAELPLAMLVLLTERANSDEDPPGDGVEVPGADTDTEPLEAAEALLDTGGEPDVLTEPWAVVLALLEAAIDTEMLALLEAAALPEILALLEEVDDTDTLALDVTNVLVLLEAAAMAVADADGSGGPNTENPSTSVYGPTFPATVQAGFEGVDKTKNRFL